MTTRARVIAAVAVVALAWAAPHPAGAQCSFTGLTSGVSVPTSLDPTYGYFTQSADYWAVVAVRPPSGSDWDLDVYQTALPDPPCVSSQLAYSNQSLSVVDFVAGDFNFGSNPTGTYYARAYVWGGGGTARLEYDDGADLLVVRGPSVEHSLVPGDLIAVWDVRLEAGVEYSFQFFPGGTGAHLLLMMNTTGGVCWKGRGSAEFDVGGVTTYLAPATGWYAAVVVNDQAQSGTVRLGVGTCSTPVALNSGGPMQTQAAYEYFSFDQAEPSWTAIGVRGGGANYDIHVNSAASGTTFPNCLGPELATSQWPGGYADFVLGDFHVNGAGTYWAGIEIPGGLGSPGAIVEWDDGPDELTVGGWPVSRTTGPNDVLEVWDVWLEAGQDYNVSISHGGPASPTVCMYANPGQAPYWTGRSGAFACMTWPAPGGDMTFTAPSTGHHALVVVNDGNQSSTYSLWITGCSPPVAMTPGVVYPTLLSVNHQTFQQTAPYWTAVGVRGPGDWEQLVYSTWSGDPPLCVSDLLAGSYGVGVVDFVVGDFNFSLPGTNYSLSVGGLPQGAIQWDSGANQLPVDGIGIERATDGSGVLEVWDANLAAGAPYSLRLVSVGPAVFSVYVFENPTNSPWWGAPVDQLFGATTPIGPQTFTPLRDGWHGVVVVNENGMPGWYTLRLNEGVLDVDEPIPERTELAGIVPNPARGRASIRFSLREPAEVSFDVHDLAGRRVARLPSSSWGAGEWSAAWDGRGTTGRRVAPGIYVVRMRIGDLEVGRRSLTIIE